MRPAVVLALACLAVPAEAWEFSVSEVCELRHEMQDGRVRVTYDPRIGEYAIHLTRVQPWATGPVFAIRFDGPRGLTISTDRHALSEDGATLTVRDRGFGNVLNGLEFNQTATALAGGETLRIPLAGAAGPVREFRACAAGGVA